MENNEIKLNSTKEKKTNTFPLWRGTKGEERSKPTNNYTEINNFLVNITNGK